MSSLYITEHSISAKGGTSQLIPTLLGVTIADQTAVSFTTTSVQSSAFNSATEVVRVVADTNCYLKFGANPTATTATGIRLTANIPESFTVTPGHKVAVVQ